MTTPHYKLLIDRLTSNTFNLISLCSKLCHQQIPMIALNLKHPIFNSPPAATFFLQISNY